MKQYRMTSVLILLFCLTAPNAFADDPARFQSAEIIDANMTSAEKGGVSLLKIRVRNAGIDALTILGVKGEWHQQSRIVADLGEGGYTTLETLYLPREEDLNLASTHILIYLENLRRSVKVGEKLNLQLVLAQGELPFSAHVIDAREIQ